MTSLNILKYCVVSLFKQFICTLAVASPCRCGCCSLNHQNYPSNTPCFFNTPFSHAILLIKGLNFFPRFTKTCFSYVNKKVCSSIKFRPWLSSGMTLLRIQWLMAHSVPQLPLNICALLITDLIAAVSDCSVLY